MAILNLSRRLQEFLLPFVPWYPTCILLIEEIRDLAQTCDVFNVQPPSVGDTTIPAVVQMGLIASLLLVSMGALLLIRRRAES